MTYSLIISDLHLTEQRPETVALFFNFLQNKAKHADALYILGDFFEYWIGDDDLSPFNLAIINALKQFSDSGIPLFFMHGNRDFFIGKRFAKMTGARLLPDPIVVDFYGTKVILSHGDLLCTDDKKYQRSRRMAHWTWLRLLVLSLPLKTRRKAALSIRRKSAARIELFKAEGQNRIGDVNQDAVAAFFQDYQCNTLIHGHTHRFNTHHTPDGQTRIVLGDWHDTGSYVELTPDSIELKKFAL